MVSGSALVQRCVSKCVSESDIDFAFQETESFQREDAGDASMVSSEAQLGRRRMLKEMGF